MRVVPGTATILSDCVYLYVRVECDFHVETRAWVVPSASALAHLGASSMRFCEYFGLADGERVAWSP